MPPHGRCGWRPGPDHDHPCRVICAPPRRRRRQATGRCRPSGCALSVPAWTTGRRRLGLDLWGRPTKSMREGQTAVQEIAHLSGAGRRRAADMAAACRCRALTDRPATRRARRQCGRRGRASAHLPAARPLRAPVSQQAAGRSGRHFSRPAFITSGWKVTRNSSLHGRRSEGEERNADDERFGGQQADGDEEPEDEVGGGESPGTE
jgi:hypothetical protein